MALIGSGRTDAGVHARGQVANFRTESAIPLKAFHQGLNSLLPKDIAVLEATEAPSEFHARKSARAKTYEYRILNRRIRSPLHHHYAWWIAQPLDLAAMAGAAADLPGEHDFTAFRASGSDNLNPVRRVLAGQLAGGPGGWLVFTHHRHRVSPGHGAEPGGHHGGGRAGESAADASWGSCWPAAPATWPDPPRRPRGFIWWKCSMRVSSQQ